MHAQLAAAVLALASFSTAYPLEARTVAALDQPGFQAAQARDNTATRAFTATAIKTGGGQCLSVDLLGGDTRANLAPINVVTCSGAQGEQWDVITAGKHNSAAGTALLVNDLSGACMNFDPRRAAGNQVIMFSCGGRADGQGQQVNSQQFAFTGGAGPQALTPGNGAGSCMAVKGGVLDAAPCNAGDPNQSFSFGGAAAAGAGAGASASGTSASAASTTTAAATGAASTTPAATPANTPAAKAVVVASSSTAAVSPASTSAASSTSAAASPAATPSPTGAAVPAGNPTTPVPVSRAGGTLNPSNVAESQKVDTTATKGASSVALKAANGQCLFVDPTAGDFRENLIPVAMRACDGSANTKFDLITSGVHNSAPGTALVVSSLMNGCLNFDPRRAAGDQVLMFSCGGRADGQGQQTNSQQFPFTAGATSVQLAPLNANNATCLVAAGATLGSAACTGQADQLFTFA